VWWMALLASQLAVVAVWWRWGWTAGLPAMLASHLPLLWGTRKPGSRLFSPVLSRIPTHAPVVALTIDDAPSADPPATLDPLASHAAKATFFLVGERARIHPGRVREIVRRGHGIGNHSHSHPQAVFWALGPARMREQVGLAQTEVTESAGVPPRWFRAVVGRASPVGAAAPREIGRRGHGIGNHSHSHPQAVFWALGPARMREQIGLAQTELTDIAGVAPRWFRAVVGMANPFVAAALREHGLARVAWSARGFDA